METKTVILPEDALVAMLKALPEDVLADLFWKVMVDYDVSPITDEEREAVKEAGSEFDKGETISWEDIK